MNRIRTIILDDEHKPREALQIKLEKNHPEIEVVALCQHYMEAMEKIISLKPQLLFLDINMPEKSGLELLQLLRDAAIHIKVIITTAYPNKEYFRKAIHLSVVDYLLKPIQKDELEEALDKVKLKINEETVVAETERVLPMSSQPLQYEFSCAVGKIFAYEQQIGYIKAEGNYCRIYMSDGRYEVVTESMKELEEKLAGTTIVRADRSHFINKSLIQKIVTTSNRCYFISSVQLPPVELNESGIKSLMKL